MNKNKLGFVLVAALLFLIVDSGIVLSQQGSSINEVGVTLGSPEATELAKHGGVEVSMFKGVPNITVPIHTLSVKGFSLPIYMSYDASGVKVDQIATNVGLGWSLNAGGQITSSVYSEADVIYDFDMPDSTLFKFDPNYFTYTGGWPNNYAYAQAMFDPLGAASRNTKPDIFYYNFPGSSGKFMINQPLDDTNGFKAYSVPVNNLDILTNGSVNLGFTIKDESGNTFKFSELETSSTNKKVGSCSASQVSPSDASGFDNSHTWLLSEIITANNDTISFSYDTKTSFTYDDNLVQRKYIRNTVVAGCDILPDFSCQYEKTITKKVLTSITHSRSGQIIDLNYSGTGDRDDFGDGELDKLGSIDIKRHGQVVKSFDLSHSYFTSPGTAPSGEEEKYKRLKLDSITQDGMPGYEFDYDESGDIPHRGSYAQDTWGYYNGKTANSTLVPNGEGMTGAADRSVDTSKVGFWSMEKITYPTGGQSILTMEGDTAGGGLRIKSINDTDGFGNESGRRTYTYERHDFLAQTFKQSYETYIPGDGEGDSPSCQYDMYTASHVQPLNLMDSPDYGYKKVTIHHSSGGVDGKSVYEYSLGAGTNRLAWGRGDLLKESHYTSDSKLLKRVENINETDLTQSKLSVAVAGLGIDDSEDHEVYYPVLDIQLRTPESTDCGGAVCYKPAKFEVESFILGTGWYRPTETVVTTYDPQDSTKKSITFTRKEYEESGSSKASRRLRAVIEANSDTTMQKRTEFVYATEVYAPYQKRINLYSIKEIELGTNVVLSKKTQTFSRTLGTGRWEKHKVYEKSSASDSVLIQQINHYDNYGNPLETEDVTGIKTAYDWSEDGAVPIGIFQNADKDNVFAHSFALNGLDENIWDETDAVNSVTTSWSIEDGKLKMYHPGTVGSNWGADYIKATLAAEYTDRTVIEMDVVIGNDNHYSLTISAGGSSYPGGNGGSENLIWTSFKNGVWKYYNGSTFLDIKSGFIANQTYNLKIIADPATSKVDYYVNGEIVKTAVDGRTATTGIQTIGIGNYGRSSIASTFYIDNVRIYPEDAQAVSQEVDPVFRTSLAMKDVAGSTTRFNFDEFGRLNETFNPNGERVSRNVYYYSLDDHSSFDDEYPNRVESITYNDPADTTDKTISVSYLDGLGRGIQSQVRGGSSTIITDTRYNERGLPEVTSRPFELSNQTTYLANAFEGSGSFSPGDTLHATSEIENEYESLPDSAGRYAYSQVKYEASPLARTEKSTLPGASHKMGSGNEMEMSYGLNTTESFNINGKTWAANTLSKTVSRDSEGNETITYTDGWGQTIVSGTNMNPGSDDILNKSSSDLVTYFEYDLKGNLVRVEDPRGLATTYTYNQKGELTSKKLPDQEYSVSYRYDEKGRLRFTQDPNQKSTELDLSTNLSGNNTVIKTLEVTSKGVLSYSILIYDLFMDGYVVKIRHVENGNSVIHSDSVDYDDELTGSIVVDPGTYVFYGNTQDEDEPIAGTNGTYSFSSYDIYTYTKYDELDRPVETGEYAGTTSFMSANPDNDTFPTTGNDPSIQYYYDGDHTAFSPSYIPDNAKGKLTKISYRDLSSVSGWGHDWFSYNNLGLVEWKITQPAFLSTPKLIEYDYDELGRLTESRYQPTNSEKFFQRYSYDALGRMEKVETSTNGSTWIKDAEYTSFFADGQVGQLKLGNTDIQTVDYSYTVQGWLEKINNGSISTGSKGDRFGMYLDYDFNGNINLQEWRQVGTSGTDQSLMSYNYAYDNANRLSSASNGDSSYCSGLPCSFDVNYTYDKNGNITDIVRHTDLYGYDFGTYSAMNYNDYNIQFETNTNRIDSVNHIENVSGSSTDHGGLQVTYDANGNMISNEMQGFSSVDYDWRNLPAQLIKGANTIQYAYDAEGNRVKKKMVSGVETHYVRGAGGETIAIYQADTLLFHNILAGADIIGNHKNGARKYFLKDHLGSVRTTVDESGGVVGYSDYYPFGLEMPGRSSNSANPNDKYKFTGHERDDEAGLNLDYMGARYYDPAVPHFLSIDPLADQFPGVSPYVYAMNNPLKYTDPTGMAPEECCLVPFSTLGALAAVGKSKLDNSLGETGKIGYKGSFKYNIGGNVALQANSLGLTLNAFSTDVIGFDVNIEYSSSEGLTGDVDLITPDGSIDQEFGGGVGPVGVSQSNSYTKTEGQKISILTGSDETIKAVEGGPVKLESITNNNTGQKTARVSAGLDYKVAFGHGFDASSRVYVQKDVKEIKEKIQNE